MKSESLKAAREGVIFRMGAAGYLDVNWLRELQRQAIEAAIRYEHAEPRRPLILVERRPDRIDALLDGPAPEDRERQVAAEARGWDTTGGEE